MIPANDVAGTPAEYLPLLERLAAPGGRFSIVSHVALARIYRYGVNDAATNALVVAQDRERGIGHLECAARLGCSQSMYELGLEHHMAQRRNATIRWFRAALEVPGYSFSASSVKRFLNLVPEVRAPVVIEVVVVVVVVAEYSVGLSLVVLL
jgi:hypothetical protein